MARLRAWSACLLVAGCVGGAPPGQSSSAVTSCEKDAWIANPVLNDCRVSTVLPCARSEATLVPLPDGRALYVGGFAGGNFSGATNEVDLFSLGACGEAASFTPITSLPASIGAVSAAWIPFKKNHANTGRLLVAGGRDSTVPFDGPPPPGKPFGGLQSEAYLYDPATGIWTQAASMPLGRANPGPKHLTAVLNDGSVLLYGGRATDSPPAFIPPSGQMSFWDTPHTYRYFPKQDQWKSVDMAEGRHYGDQALLSDGRLVVAGGRAVIPSGVDFALRNTIEVYDPEVEGWRIAAHTPPVAGEDAPPYAAGVIPDPNGGRIVQAMARTPDDKVLIVGGVYREPPWNCRNLSTLTFIDTCPASGVCPADGALCRPCPGEATCGANSRCNDPAQTACFPRGRGLSRTSVLVFDPATDSVDLATPMPEPRRDHQMQYLGGGEFLVAGGSSTTGDALTATTLIFHYTGDPSQGYGTWRIGPPLPGIPPSGTSSFIRGQAELEYGRLADGTLWIGNGFDATAAAMTKPNGRSYVLAPSNPLPPTFGPPHGP